MLVTYGATINYNKWKITTKNKFKNDPTPDWEMDESHIEHLRGLGLWDEEEDGEEYISSL